MNDDEFESAWNSDNFATEPEDLTEESLEELPEDPESDDGELEDAEPETTDEVVEEPEEPEEGAPQDPVDYKSAYLAAQAELKTTVGRLKAAEARAQKPENAPSAPASAEPSDDDKFLEKFRADYNDDVLRAVGIMSRKAATELIETQILPRIEPISRTNEELVVQAHFGAIESAHPDVYEIDQSPEFNAWIASKPLHVRGAYEFVREQGTPAEVIEMLNEYKAVMQVPAQVAKPAASTKGVAVPRRRGASPVAAAPSKDDFEAAWMEAPDR